MTARPSAGDDRGRTATTPSDIPPRGLKDVVVRTLAEARTDQLSLLAAGVAFYGLLALVPALVAIVSIYGIVADPSDVGRHVGHLLGAAPGEVRALVREQLEAIASRPDSQAGIGIVFGIAIALWSASSGMKHLIDALNVAYDEEEGRGFAKVRGLSLLLTVGAVAFLTSAFLLVAVVPSVLEGPVTVLRWPVLAVTFTAALALLYRKAPSRDDAEWRWVTPGAVVGTGVWLAGSGLFSLYVSRFGSYSETYGSLGSIVVLLLWLFLTAAAVLLGAELDAELERQTTYDTTEGRDEPMGERDAAAADTLGPTAEQVRADRAARKADANH